MNVLEDSMKTFFKQELIKLTFPILKFFENKFSNLIKKNISFKFMVMMAINASDGNPKGL